MTITELVSKNRSYRRFDGGHTIAAETLRGLIALARLTPSGSNRQPLKYILSSDPKTNAKIYDTLSWAGSLKDWAGPEPAERPTGFIVILVDTAIVANADRDIGIVAQTMLLGAVDVGLGGCMIGSIRRPELREVLGVAEGLDIALVVALGKPVERIVIDDAEPGASVTYYREPDMTHHVPKRTLSELVVAEHHR